MTTLNSTTRRGSSILAALLAVIITVVVLGVFFGIAANKVAGMVEHRQQTIEQQIEDLG